IVGGAGSNAGAVLGAVVVWGLWSLSGLLTSVLLTGDQQARAASLQIVAIGVMLVVILLVRPRGLVGEGLRRRPPPNGGGELDAGELV
ncbi:MAG: hypothetical protein JOZ40_24430, partial [Methylobacteriaceae bacterium]|nr:hypothetical protein [Methylobacteriaceae bacterium]